MKAEDGTADIYFRQSFILAAKYQLILIFLVLSLVRKLPLTSYF